MSTFSQSNAESQRASKFSAKGIWPKALLMLLLAMLFISQVSAHGRLLEPPSRSTMWRKGFHNPENFNDNELFCGGLQRMINNGNRCGICGDAYDIPPPRPNEAGGLYSNGIIVKRYKMNQIIEAQVDLTANHKGYFQFRICPLNKPSLYPEDNPSQDCFDQHILKLADGTGTKHAVFKTGDKKWTYTAGNNWGHCANGTDGMGCGTQEMFRACADVAIEKRGTFEYLVRKDEADDENEVSEERS